jgi:hypothetical protein
MDKLSGTGLGVDRQGNPVIDPTENVLQLVESAIKRLDDIAYLRAEYTEKLIAAEAKRIDTAASLRAEYTEKLSAAESRRIDAIRSVDVGAVAIASERAAQQATVLATQVAASAETLRALVATTATTVASQLASVSGSLTERIAVLEQSSYVGLGKQAVSDPMLSELVAEMKKLREARDMGTGRSVGSAAMWGYLVAAIGVLFGLAGIILAVVHVMKG